MISIFNQITPKHLTIAAALSLFPTLAMEIRADHASFSADVGTASPIFTGSAKTLAKGKWHVGLRAQFVDFERISDTKFRTKRAQMSAQDRSTHIHGVDTLLFATVGAFYGVTDELTVGLRLTLCSA